MLAEIAAGKSNSAIAESLVLTKRAVEKHVNSIFSKLNLPETQDVSRRVKATLIFLSEEGSTAPDFVVAARRKGRFGDARIPVELVHAPQLRGIWKHHTDALT